MTISDELWRLLGPVLLTAIATIAGGLFGRWHERRRKYNPVVSMAEENALRKHLNIPHDKPLLE